MKRFLGAALVLFTAFGAFGAAGAAQYAAPGVTCGGVVCKNNVCVSDCVRAAKIQCDQAMGRNVKYSKGYVYTWQGFPGNCGAPGQAQMLLEKRAPEVVTVGVPFTYEIQVSNRSSDLLANANITDVLPANFVLEGTDPAVTVQDGKLRFFIGDLPPRSAKVFKVTGRPTQTGCLTFCGTASASFEFPLNIAVNVTESRLELALIVGIENCGDLCECIPAKICVKSPGSATSPDNVVTLNLPEGLVDERGQSQLTWNIGDLGAGESKTIPFQLKASKLGMFDLVAQVVNSRGQSAADSAQLKVRAPDLTVEKIGPVKAYVGRELVYQVNVRNNSDCPAKNVQLVDVWSGAKVRISSVSPKASNKVNANGNRLVWNIGFMEPGEVFTATVSLCALDTGLITNTACITAYCTDPKEATITTEIVATTGVLTELVDEMDPVPAGCTVVYRVSAKNQGNRPNTNVKFTAKMEPGMEFVEATGPTNVTANGLDLTFDPVGTLAPRQEATWRVVVKMTPAAITSGSETDKRFTTYMTTDQLDSSRPVINTESTTVYQTELQMSRSGN